MVFEARSNLRIVSQRPQISEQQIPETQHGPTDQLHSARRSEAVEIVWKLSSLLSLMPWRVERAPRPRRPIEGTERRCVGAPLENVELAGARLPRSMFLTMPYVLRSLIRNVPARSLQARRKVSTASYTLTERQPSNSPIWIRAQPGSSLLEGIAPVDFQLYTNVLSVEEQNELLRCALKRLDEIRGVSRTIKKRRREALGGATAAGELANDVQSQFLPDDCYEFDEVMVFLRSNRYLCLTAELA